MGILTYEILVGFAPFESSSSRIQTYQNIAYNEPRYPSWLSPEAVSFIKVALIKVGMEAGKVNRLWAHPGL